MKGFRVGTYVLESKLGEGGMAEVWMARNEVLNTVAAVKFLATHLAGNQEIERRFVTEAKRQAHLNHPNIVSAFDFQYVDDRSFLVMRYIDGESLDHRLFKLQAPMSLADAMSVSRDVLSALQYAHSSGVVHRDIKPSNILIENGGRAYVMDFGIALALGEERLTRVGAAIGTPHYMSPEQIVGAKTIDTRTDIYSFGCVLYQMLTQISPFDADENDGNTDYAVKEKHLRQEPQPPSQLNPAIPEHIERVILRSLAKNPNDRFATCADLLSAMTEPRPRPTAPGRTPTVFEQAHPTPAPLPPRDATRVDIGTRPPLPRTESVPSQYAAPAPVYATAAAPAPQQYPVAPAQSYAAASAPKGNRGMVWAAAGVAVAALAGGGAYFFSHRDTSDQKPEAEKTIVQKKTQPGTIGPALLPTPPKAKPPAVDFSKSNGTLPITPPQEKPPVAIYKPPPPPPGNREAAAALVKQGGEQASHSDMAAARESFRKAADLGSPQAMVLFGTMCSSGQGGARDDVEAVQRFQQAADLGNARGMYNLGLMYENHRVPHAPGDDQVNAADWYEKAIKTQKVDEAAFRLGIMYEDGRGRTKNLDEARRLYRLAGTPQALSRLANLPPG